jgi:hypothetical protein
MEWTWDRSSEETFGGRYRPPDVDAVVRRSMCLAALVRRGELEEGLITESVDFNLRAAQGFTGLAADIDKWLVRERLVGDLSDYERGMLAVPAGEWPRQYLIDANWRVEALAVMLWALSQIATLPGYDSMVDNLEIVNQSGLFKSPLDFTMSARLRSYDTLMVQREIAEIWRWRVNTGRLIREGRMSRATINIDDIIGQAAEELYETYKAVLPVDGDIVAFGRPVRDLDDDEFNVVSSIAIERNIAFDWLCGYIEDWSGG